MIARLIGLGALVLLTAPAAAADRTFSVASFDRVRVEGPFEVRIVTGGAPAARAEGDRQLLDRVDIDLNGTTLVVRMGSGGWGETPGRRGGAVPIVTLATPRLQSAVLTAGARVRIDRMKGQRVDLSLAGAGSLTLDQADADQLAATLIGTGEMTIGGRANRARLVTNGPGRIDAGTMTVNDLTVRLDGTGETKAAARYTAQVTSSGLGRVTVTGGAKCTVRAIADGPVRCGLQR